MQLIASMAKVSHMGEAGTGRPRPADGEPVPTSPTPQFSDVSHYEPNVDWDRYATTGSPLAVCKATEGTVYTDSTAPPNREALKRLDLYCGLYHFAGSSVYHQIADPKVEADFFLKKVGPLGPKEFPILDFEEKYNLTPPEQVTWIGKWCAQVQEKTGKTPWLYAGRLLAKMDAQDLTKYPLWLANWKSNDPQHPPSSLPWTGLTAWQYTDHADVPGIGPCDESFLFGDLSKLVAPGSPPPSPGP